MSIANARIIDVHAHIVLEQSLGAAGAHGPELTVGEDGRPLFRVGGYRLHGVRYRASPFMDVRLRLAAMDEAGIDFQVVSPNPLTYFHFIDAREAVIWCRRHNDALAEQLAPHADRLGGLAALPMQDPEAAAAELTRAVTELGLLGGYVGTDFGAPLDARELDIFYERCVALDVPLFLHPAPAGIDGPAAYPPLDAFDLDLLIGFAAQETAAIGRLIFGGVLERHPKLDVCISHGGGAIGMLAGRFAQAARSRPWSRATLREPGAFEAQLRRLWVDDHVHGEEAVATLERLVGPEHIVLGTNFAGWDQTGASKLKSTPARLADNARRLLRVGRDRSRSLQP